ncbi:MAG: hypothetical protein ABIP28_01555 [Mucilaginibacter sp.]
MKALIYLICLMMFAACTGNQNRSIADDDNVADSLATVKMVDSMTVADSLEVVAAKKAFKPYKLINGFTVIDTGYYGSGTLDGYYAIVEKGDKQADTIHLSIGLQHINKENYLFLRLCRPHYQEEMSFGTLNLHPDQYIVALNGREVPLTRLVKHFDLYKSAPHVINNKIYFSQYKSNRSGNFDVSAAEYSPETGIVRSQFLITDNLDEEHASFWPHGENGRIIFYGYNHVKWTFSHDFKLLK